MVNGASSGPALDTPRPVPATPGSPGPVGGRAPTGSCAGMSPEPALAKAGGGWRLDRAADGASRTPSAQRVGVVDAVAASQRRRHQRHHLVAGVGSAWGATQVQVPVNQFGQAQMPAQRGWQDQPSIGHQAVVIKGDLDAVGVVIW